MEVGETGDALKALWEGESVTSGSGAGAERGSPAHQTHRRVDKPRRLPFVLSPAAPHKLGHLRARTLNRAPLRLRGRGQWTGPGVLGRARKVREGRGRRVRAASVWRRPGEPMQAVLLQARGDDRVHRGGVHDRQLGPDHVVIDVGWDCVARGKQVSIQSRAMGGSRGSREDLPEYGQSFGMMHSSSSGMSAVNQAVRCGVPRCAACVAPSGAQFPHCKRCCKR